MSTMTVEEKMMLIQKMRNHSDDNSSKMRNRDQIYRGVNQSIQDPTLEEPAFTGLRMFKFRVFICLLAFGTFVCLDRYGLKIQGYTATQVVQKLQSSENIAKDQQEKAEAWSQNVVKKLVSDQLQQRK